MHIAPRRLDLRKSSLEALTAQLGLAFTYMVRRALESQDQNPQVGNSLPSFLNQHNNCCRSSDSTAGRMIGQVQPVHVLSSVAPLLSPPPWR
jgi:hypothetical protein